jgi:AcrR family transcriptional regulator
MAERRRPARTRRGAGPARKPAYHHGNLREALVAQARALLEEGGVAGLSLRGVARRAGVSGAAPYHHFRDKEALLGAVAADGFRAFTQALRRGTQSGGRDPELRLRKQGAAYVEFAVGNPALFRLMMGGEHGTGEPDSELKAAGRDAFEQLRDAAAQAAAGADQGEPRRLRLLALWATVHGLAMLILDRRVDPASYGFKSVRDLAEAMLDEILDG